MSAPLIPCPFCAAGETRTKDNTYWTGMSSVLLSVEIQHWCDEASHITMRGKTLAEATERWNRRAGHHSVIATLKRLRDALRPSKSPLATEMFVSKTTADEIERILPGEVLTVILHGRKFAIVEREEFDVILERAGMRCKAQD